MRKINRESEPDFFVEYKRKNPKGTYSDLDKTSEGRAVRQSLREHLVRTQFYLCAYCCKEISVTNSLNEHINPQSKASDKTMDYENLVASCITEGQHRTCGVKKEDDYDAAKFVSPLQEDCETHFLYYPNGEMDGTTDKGAYTVELLGLNEYELCQARRAMYKNCEDLHSEELVRDYYLTAQNGKLEPYSDMIRYFYERGDFGV